MAILTAIVGVASGDQSPREFGFQIDERVCPIQIDRTGYAGILGEHGIVETCARVVCVDIEVVVILIGSTGRLEMEALGLPGSDSDRSCDGRGSQQKKGCEKLHLEFVI